MIAASGQDVKTYPAARDGVMVLTYDGEEGLTKDNFTDADFDKSNYKSTNLERQHGNSKRRTGFISLSPSEDVVRL